ncbi:MAG: glycosyltransferase family 2 protein [Planctomycetes bacterium]|nr:glycosyltransferase family 2 protein [Planctomycetota bacterium]MBI3834658.1 glycosyltransferase family 2 protein [Planctomycetota bacterium]
MYKGKSIIAVIPARDEELKIGRVVERIDFDLVDAVLVVDDGSTDSTPEVALRRGARVISLGRICGVGAAIRAGLQFGRSTGHDLAVILAGNNKDNPAEIPRLLDPICDNKADFVMGSRYLAGGSAAGDMPLYRRLATRLHPWLMSRFAGKPLTESTNGFRAFRLSILDDPRIDPDQRWLDSYGLEVYLLWKVITLGYLHTEVPCTKVYPPRSLGFTKMKPIIDWWTILRPILLLGLGMKS